MLRVVLDTNVLLSILRRESKHRWIFDAVLQGNIQVAISQEILLEYEEVLGQRISPEIGKNVVDLLLRLPLTFVCQPSFQWNLISSDPDDNKFVDCAFASNSVAIITYDKHFAVLKLVEFPPLLVLTPEELARHLESQEN